jgi:hypothetical protein
MPSARDRATVSCNIGGVDGFLGFESTAIRFAAGIASNKRRDDFREVPCA